MNKLSLLFRALKAYFYSLLRGEARETLAFLRGQIQTHRRRCLRDFYMEFSHLHFTKMPKEEKVKKSIAGLHQHLSQDGRIRFSIVLPDPPAALREFKMALDSAFSQTARNFEVIALFQVPEAIEKAYPDLKINQEPTGTHIFILNSHAWMRLDLLYRYEQVLRSLQNNRLILHTQAVSIDVKDRLIPGSLFLEPRKTYFPYEFTPFTLDGLLIPKELYSPQSTLWDLDAQGGQFLGIPLPLLATRPYLAQNEEKDFLSLFQQYIRKKELLWEMKEGWLPGSVRAIPYLSRRPRIQAIVPYKENKTLTLAAIYSLLKSEGVDLFITALDNGSEDRTIAIELEALGCEVLRIEEPFNYSRLNNLAVLRTRYPQDLVFFMNNDAEIAPDALLEMSRWIDQPHVGLVGCRLHYPQGPLQHGGVSLDPSQALPGALNWVHNELGVPFEKSVRSRLIHVPDAVTAAAALIRRDLFLKVGGFDEVLYPIAYSDTHLAHKLRQQGLACLYTPYAHGIHHESLSREPGLLEDFDRSIFLHNLEGAYKVRSDFVDTLLMKNVLQTSED